MADLAGKWKTFGISLGISKSALESICLGSHAECLTEMLALWLKQGYNVRTTFILNSPHFLYRVPYFVDNKINGRDTAHIKYYGGDQFT